MASWIRRTAGWLRKGADAITQGLGYGGGGYGSTGYGE